jgi:hypothetical protein
VTPSSPWDTWLERLRALDDEPPLAPLPLPTPRRSARALPRLLWAAAILLVGLRAAATLAFLLVL